MHIFAIDSPMCFLCTGREPVTGPNNNPGHSPQLRRCGAFGLGSRSSIIKGGCHSALRAHKYANHQRQEVGYQRIEQSDKRQR